MNFKSARRTISAIKSEISEMEQLQVEHKLSEQRLFNLAVERFNESLDLAMEFYRGIPKSCLPSQAVLDKIAQFQSEVGAATIAKKAAVYRNVSSGEATKNKVREFIRNNPGGVTMNEIKTHLGMSHIYVRQLKDEMGLVHIANRSSGRGIPARVYDLP